MKKITKNNKGFSLIELIIVIAIMAVLVAIIAPNLTKYLGSSKEKTDTKNKDEIESTLKTCITDYETDKGDLLTKGDTTGMTLTWGANGAYSNSATNADFDNIVKAAIDANKTQSKQDTNKYATATITRDNAGVYSISVSYN